MFWLGIFNRILTKICLYKYDLRGTNSFDETNENSRENGTSVFTQTGTIQLKKQDAATRKEMKLLGYGRPQIIIQSYDTSPGAGDLPIYKYQIAETYRTRPCIVSQIVMSYYEERL